MTSESKLEGEIRFWNKFFILFGLQAVILDKSNVRVSIIQPILIGAITCTLSIIQFSRCEASLSILDEDGVVRCVHMFGNFIVILQISLTMSKIKQCSNIQRKFRLFARCTCSEIGGKIKGYLLFPLINLTFFVSMDIAEYFFLQPEVNSVDIVPVISGHILILYDILYTLHFSVHLSWLKALIVSSYIQLSKVSDRFRGKKAKERRRIASRITLLLSMSNQLEESDNEKAAETIAIVKDIQISRYLYNESYQISQEINDTYATRNLITISFSVLVGIIFLAPAVGDNITVVTSQIKSDVASEAITAEHIIFHCKWSVTCFITVYGLIRACRLTTSEVRLISSLVYDILEFPLDSKIKTELYRFALQLLHSNIKFSAHEFFTLNHKLFLSILGTLVSFVVVMFQLNT